MASIMVSFIIEYGLCCRCVYDIWVCSGFSLIYSLVFYDYVFGYSERVSFGGCYVFYLFE